MNTGMTMVPTFFSGAFGSPGRAPGRCRSRAARVDEGDPVDARHVHTFAEAAGVAEQAALAVVEAAEMSEQHWRVAGGHLA